MFVSTTLQLTIEACEDNEDAMSALMFVNLGDGRWPTDEQVARFKAGGRPTALHEAHGSEADDGEPASAAFVDAAAAEFHRRTGHRVRIVLTGFRDTALAARLYRDHGVPVKVVFSAPDVDAGRHWPAALRSADGVTACAWNPRAHDADAVTAVLDFADALADQYRSYADGPRVLLTSAGRLPRTADDVYTSVLDGFGDGLRAVEPALDAVLEQLCGSGDGDGGCGGGRWTSADVVVEHGDVAAEDARRLTSPPWNRPPGVATDYLRRVARVTASFGAAFWRDVAGDGGPSASVDRTLAACLVQNVRAAAVELADLSDEQFAACLNAKFIATRRWRRVVARPAVTVVASGTETSRPSLFRPEIRERCERFLAVHHLTDLLLDQHDSGVGHVFTRSHVEHLEPYVLPQRLVEYTAQHYRHEVRYFALTDTLVFRFADAEPGQLIETNHKHRFTGPANFKEFHDEMFRIIDYMKYPFLK